MYTNSLLFRAFNFYSTVVRCAIRFSITKSRRNNRETHKQAEPFDNGRRYRPNILLYLFRRILFLFLLLFISLFSFLPLLSFGHTRHPKEHEQALNRYSNRINEKEDTKQKNITHEVFLLESLHR